MTKCHDKIFSGNVTICFSKTGKTENVPEFKYERFKILDDFLEIDYIRVTFIL